MQAIIDNLRHFITDNFLYGVDISNLQNDTSLINSGLVDSAGIMEVVAYVEETFNISVDDADLLPTNFDSMNGIAHFINNKKMRL
ncbi:MAG: acyl carrier protein [Bdellovibrio sp.]|nr:acyl carrier protein [Bdellovibrio sp.]